MQSYEESIKIGDACTEKMKVSARWLEIYKATSKTSDMHSISTWKFMLATSQIPTAHVKHEERRRGGVQTAYHYLPLSARRCCAEKVPPAGYK